MMNRMDYLLSRAPTMRVPDAQPQLSAALNQRGVPLTGGAATALAAASPNDVLLLLHGYDHTREMYRLHSRVLALSSAPKSWLRTRTDLLLYVNSKSASVHDLIPSLQGYRLGSTGLRMLIHTDLDLDHQCAEFQLLHATRGRWARYRWVVYCSGPDEYLTPPAVMRIQDLLVDASSVGGKAPPALYVFPFPRPSPPPRFCGFRGNATHCVRMMRHSLDVFLFRPGGGFLQGDNARAGASASSIRTMRASAMSNASTSAWANATAVCAAHTPYHGLAESVFWWMQATWRLDLALLGPMAPARVCRPGAAADESIGPCPPPKRARPLGSAGVWHTHNVSAVSRWVARERALHHMTGPASMNEHSNLLSNQGSGHRIS